MSHRQPVALAGLVARTRATDVPPDLLAEAGDHGLLWQDADGGLAGHGVAAELRLAGGLGDAAGVRAVQAALASIRIDDPLGLPGCGPVALGALPFDRDAPGRLVVPQRIVGRCGDRGWVTTIRPDGPVAGEATDDNGSSGTNGPSASIASSVLNGTGRNGSGAPNGEVGPNGSGGPNGEVGDPPDEFVLRSSMTHHQWRAAVADAVEVLRRGDLDKVVLARRVDITANRAFVVSDVLGRLAALYPSCMIFSVDGFVGASPELLLRRRGRAVESHPLAGTVARSGDARADQTLATALMASPKARHEHQVVVDALRRTLAEVCDRIDVPEQPSVVGLRNVSHLGTRITGTLASTGHRPGSLELVAAIHPTPAVAGRPTDQAIEYLRQVEGFDRGCYAGPVGWVDARGDGAWAVGIRCAEIDGARAHIYAGNGIVAGSDPAEELAETQLKLQALLAALVRP